MIIIKYDAQWLLLYDEQWWLLIWWTVIIIIVSIIIIKYNERCDSVMWQTGLNLCLRPFLLRNAQKVYWNVQEVSEFSGVRLHAPRLVLHHVGATRRRRGPGGGAGGGACGGRGGRRGRSGHRPVQLLQTAASSGGGRKARPLAAAAERQRVGRTQLKVHLSFLAPGSRGSDWLRERTNHWTAATSFVSMMFLL